MAAPETAVSTWVVGGGEMGERIRALDWSRTPLGPLESWPPALRTAVGMLLSSRAQIVLFWGPHFTVLYNDAYRPVFGGKHPGALGLSGREAWSEIWDDQLGPLLKGVVESGEAYWAQDLLFCIQRHGYLEETYFDISYDPVRDENGDVVGVNCIVTETTARVCGERRLRALSTLGRIGLGAQSVSGILDGAAKVLGENTEDIAFALLYEWNAAASGAKLRAQVGIAPDHPAVPDEVFTEADSPWPLHARLPAEGVILDARRQVAEPLPGGRWPENCVRVAVLPIGVPSQPPDGFLVAGLAPRRAIDAAYRDFLRLVVAGIGAALSNAKALEAERHRAEALAELDRAKTTFFSNVSHEFRTPLTLLLGPLREELSGDAIPARSRENLDVAYRNGVRLLKLVNALLDFSRIEAGRLRARYEPTDLAAFTKELASNFESAMKSAGITLTVSCGRLAEPAFVDRDMWEKIVLNLLSNAFKFTFEGGIDVQLAQSNGNAVLTVRDSGVGIAAEEMPRLFERFHRVEGVRSRTHEGSGIGLAMVQELVRMHGGEIRAQSQPLQGSVFTVSIPLGCSHLPQDQVVAQPAAAAATSNTATFVQEAMAWLRLPDPAQLPEVAPVEKGRTRILVADDNADMREYVERLLAEHWDVVSVADGETAMQALFTARFDLVITDVMMPRMDGFGLIKAMRSDPTLRDLPVIMLSARAGEDERIEGRTAGADDYLVKPFSARELVAQVRAQLEVAAARRASARERETLLSRERSAHLDLQRQWEDLVRFFEQSPNPIVMLRGRDHVIELANEAACKLWGRPAEEVRYRPLFEALPEITGQGLEALLDGVLETGIPYTGRRRRVRLNRNGAMEDFYLDFVYSPLRAAGGRIEGIAVTAIDVTEHVVGLSSPEAFATT